MMSAHPLASAVRSLSLSALALSAVPAMGDGLPQSPARTTPVKVYWNVTTDAWDLQSGSRTDWASRVNKGNIPMDGGICVLYSHRLGLYPLQGPQAVTNNPLAMQAHLAKLRSDLDAQVPDINYSGILVIDYEAWNLLWDVTDDPIKAAWTQYEQSLGTHPLRGLSGQALDDALRTSYEKAGKDFYLATIGAMRQARPLAKIALYDHPCSYGGTAWAYDEPEWSAILRARNDRLAWLWQALDVITPSLYPWRATMPEGVARDPRYEYTPSEDRQFIRSLLKEAKRVANGKPVYAYVWDRYLDSSGPHSNQLCNATTMDVLFDEIDHSSIDGIILWESLVGQDQFNTYQQYYTTEFLPHLRDVTVNISGSSGATPGSGGAQPAGGSGGGGTGGGSSGGASNGGSSGGAAGSGGSPSGGSSSGSSTSGGSTSGGSTSGGSTSGGSSGSGGMSPSKPFIVVPSGGSKSAPKSIFHSTTKTVKSSIPQPSLSGSGSAGSTSNGGSTDSSGGSHVIIHLSTPKIITTPSTGIFSHYYTMHPDTSPADQ